MLGDQTVRTPETGRRLLIGEGTIGNGVQCGVDVGMVAANIANMGALTARVASVLVAPKDPCVPCFWDLWELEP